LQINKHAVIHLIPEAAIKENGHPRLKKGFTPHQPYGRKADYVEGVKNADLTKMAKLVKIVGVLLQSKVYLFWRNSDFQERAGMTCGIFKCYGCKPILESQDISE